MSFVPAWKRIGLKLKNDPEEAVALPSSDVTNDPSETPTAKKRKNTKPMEINQHHELCSRRQKARTERGSDELGNGTSNAKFGPLGNKTNEKSAIREKKKKSKENARGEGLNKTVQLDCKSFSSPSSSAKRDSTHGCSQVSAASSDCALNGTYSPLSGDVSLTPRPRRKSVTFTEETKREDGSSAQKLFHEMMEREKAGELPTTLVHSPESIGEEKKITKGAEPMVKPKGERKKLRRIKKENEKMEGDHNRGKICMSPGKDEINLLENEIAGETKTLSYIEYLHAFMEGGTSWKFNKAQQNTLLKHVLHPARVPEIEEEAIFKYLNGLQGAGSKNRLRKEATEVIKACTEEDTKSELIPLVEGSGKLRLDERKKHFKDEKDNNCEDTQTKWCKQRLARAKLVLKALDNGSAGDENSIEVRSKTSGLDSAPVQPRQSGVVMGKGKRVRLKKKRVVIASKESDTGSASDTDSDTEDSSDSSINGHRSSSDDEEDSDSIDDSSSSESGSSSSDTTKSSDGETDNDNDSHTSPGVTTPASKQ